MKPMSKSMSFGGKGRGTMREVMGEDGNRAYCDTLEEFIDYAKCDVEMRGEGLVPRREEQ